MIKHSNGRKSLIFYPIMKDLDYRRIWLSFTLKLLIDSAIVLGHFVYIKVCTPISFLNIEPLDARGVVASKR